MRRLRFSITAIFLLGLLSAGGWWVYHNRVALGRQVASYQVGAAADYAAARREMAWFESGADRDAKLRDLAAGWGTGNQQFDYYLARYLGDPQSSDALRQTFSRELAWRPELLPRWAHFWCWRAKTDPAEEIASIVAYLTTLAAAQPPRQLTWREVLDLQAVFQQSGQAELAKRLGPDNWQARFQAWSKEDVSATVKRPANPFPDWQGPPPQQKD